MFTKNFLLPASILIVVFLWASAFVVIGRLVLTVDPILLATVRAIVAGGFFLIIRLPFVKQDLTSVLKEWKLIFLMGICGIFGYNLLLNFGLIHVDPATASFLVNLVPILTLLGAVLLGWETVTFRKIIAFGSCVLGAAVISLSKGASLTAWSYSILLIIVAALSQAVYFLLVKFISQKLSPLHITMGAMWFALIALIPFSLESFLNHSFSGLEIFWLIYLGLGPSAIAFLLWSYVLKHVEAGMVSIFLFMVPLLALSMEYFIFDTIPLEGTLVGCFTILGGLLILKYKEIVRSLFFLTKFR